MDRGRPFSIRFFLFFFLLTPFDFVALRRLWNSASRPNVADVHLGRLPRDIGGNDLFTLGRDLRHPCTFLPPILSPPVKPATRRIWTGREGSVSERLLYASYNTLITSHKILFRESIARSRWDIFRVPVFISRVKARRCDDPLERKT